MLTHKFSYFNIDLHNLTIFDKNKNGDTLMNKKLPSSLILIVYGLLATFFNQVILAPYLYRFNFKLAFFLLFFAYLLQSLMIIFLKNKYEKIRNYDLFYFKQNNKASYCMYAITITLITLILLLYLIYFFFNFINNYFYVNAKYIFIMPLLFVLVSFGIYKSPYSTYQVGVIIFILFELQFLVFFFVPKNIDISILLPINISINSNLIFIFLYLLSIILFPLLSLSTTSYASTPFRIKELIILAIILFVSNTYFLFIQIKQLGVLVSYLDYPFYTIFDALDLGYYSEHLYIIPVSLCLITTFIFILNLLHSLRQLYFIESPNKIILFFAFILIFSLFLFEKVYILKNIIDTLFYLLGFLFLTLLIIQFITFRSNNHEKNI